MSCLHYSLEPSKSWEPLIHRGVQSSLPELDFLPVLSPSRPQFPSWLGYSGVVKNWAGDKNCAVRFLSLSNRGSEAAAAIPEHGGTQYLVVPSPWNACPKWTHQAAPRLPVTGSWLYFPDALGNQYFITSVPLLFLFSNLNSTVGLSCLAPASCPAWLILWHLSSTRSYILSLLGNICDKGQGWFFLMQHEILIVRYSNSQITHVQLNISESQELSKCRSCRWVAWVHFQAICSKGSGARHLGQEEKWSDPTVIS